MARRRGEAGGTFRSLQGERAPVRAQHPETGLLHSHRHRGLGQPQLRGVQHGAGHRELRRARQLADVVGAVRPDVDRARHGLHVAVRVLVQREQDRPAIPRSPDCRGAARRFPPAAGMGLAGQMGRLERGEGAGVGEPPWTDAPPRDGGASSRRSLPLLTLCSGRHRWSARTREARRPTRSPTRCG